MSQRFRLGLDRVEASQWQVFERLASQFLADEYGALRTLATPEGDEGRDATIFQPEGDSEIAAQYSVSSDWEGKIRKTARRLNSKHAEVSVLIYASPQEIGARGDDLKRDARKRYKLHLDIRDREWFVERENRSAVTVKAADDFCRTTVDRYLADAGVIDRAGMPLSTHEARAALLYLLLQRKDDELNRHLTKSCFEGLVRAALRGTDPENTMPRQDVHEAVSRLLPTHERDEVDAYVDRALARLDRRAVRHHRKTDTFCLAYEERARLAEGIAELEAADTRFEAELRAHAEFVATAMEIDLSLVPWDDLQVRLRRILERFLSERGEAFADSVSAGQTLLFVDQELSDIATQDVAQHADQSSLRHNLVPFASQTLERLLLYPGPEVQGFLRGVADAYTLFAFLRETPNVQSAVGKIFAQGTVWLDTTAVLPLMAETLLDVEERRYTRLIESARDAGVAFRLTNGVVEEVGAHLDLCLKAARYGASWHHRTPFLLASLVWSGGDYREFNSWLEVFRGTLHPHDDLVEYLEDVLGLRVEDLKEVVDAAPADLRAHTQEYWYGVHEKRRAGAEVRADVLHTLVEHDVENFLGVVQRRSTEGSPSPYGYSSWWFTFDSYAHGAAAAIADRAGLEVLHSPVMSVDFLTYFLTVGPARRQLEKSRERKLPLIMDTSLVDAMPADLLSAADEVRQEFRGQEDRVVRRKIRDHLEKEKMRQGRVGRAGIEAIEEDIRVALESSRAAG